VSDPGFEKMLRANRYREPAVVGWQQNWLLSLFALASLVGTLAAGYHWGLPWAADVAARHMPPALEKKLGEESMAVIDRGVMLPSKLPLAEQARLRKLFAGMRQPNGDKTPYELVFRKSPVVGPNAFALPHGTIVMTDELVQLAGNDEAVLGVLAHELGHVRHRHVSRRLVLAAGTGIVTGFLFGDVSAVVAAVPGFLLDQGYSRDFERESDRYAIAMMQANGKKLSPMADLFARMGTWRAEGKTRRVPEDAASDDSDSDMEEGEDEEEQVAAEEPGRRGGENPEKNSGKGKFMDYLSSHPSDDERIAALRAADRKNTAPAR